VRIEFPVPCGPLVRRIENRAFERVGHAGSGGSRLQSGNRGNVRRDTGMRTGASQGRPLDGVDAPGAYHAHRFPHAISVSPTRCRGIAACAPWPDRRICA
jgi:hypothetical protein